MANRMMFRTLVNNFRNEPAFNVVIEAETGKPATITVQDATTVETVLLISLPQGVSMNLATAFGLVGTMEQEQLKDDLLGRGGS